MVEQVYNSLSTYFTHLENTGYMSKSNINKLLVLILIQEFIDNDCRGYLNEDDYLIINQALECIYGTTCLIPYPNYYNCKTRKVMYTGSCSELAHRVYILEQQMAEGCQCEGGGSDIENKAIIVPGDGADLHGDTHAAELGYLEGPN